MGVRVTKYESGKLIKILKNFLIREQYQLSIRVEHTWILVLCYNCLATLRIFHAADFKVLVGSHSFSKYPSFRRLKSFLYCGINGKCKCKFLSVADNNTNTKCTKPIQTEISKRPAHIQPNSNERDGSNAH